MTARGQVPALLWAALFTASLVLPLSGAAQTLPMTIPPASDSSQIKVVVKPGLKRTRDLPNAHLRRARVDLLARKVVSDQDLRALANRGEGLAAGKYVQLLTQRGVRENASDIAYYASIAAGTGRVYMLDDMIRAMQYLDPETEPKARIRQLISVLYPYAWAGNAMAMDALIDHNGEGRLFGALSERTRQKILTHAEGGDGRIELKLAVRLLENENRTEEDMIRARQYLDRAERSDHLAVKTTAANLIALIDDQRKEAGAATN